MTPPTCPVCKAETWTWIGGLTAVWRCCEGCMVRWLEGAWARNSREWAHAIASQPPDEECDWFTAFREVPAPPYLDEPALA